MTSGGPDRRRLSIPAQLDRLHEVREFVDGATLDAGFADSARYEIKLAVNEAVTNAIRHGSSSADDPVEVVIREADDGLDFCVADTGLFVHRFELPRDLPDHHLDGVDFCVADTGLFVHRFELPRDLPERGRGLDFIAELMDGLEVRPEFEGTTICFSKRKAEG